tara:strand:- start:898 stop:1422 length:525 start_codon:yes stop_codon:yes gene_type:complete
MASIYISRIGESSAKTCKADWRQFQGQVQKRGWGYWDNNSHNKIQYDDWVIIGFGERMDVCKVIDLLDHEASQKIRKDMKWDKMYSNIAKGTTEHRNALVLIKVGESTVGWNEWKESLGYSTDFHAMSTTILKNAEKVPPYTRFTCDEDKPKELTANEKAVLILKQKSITLQRP